MNCLIVLLSLTVFAALPTQSKSARPDLIVISGATEPDQIPEYLVWRNAFDILAHAGRDRRKPILDSVKLSGPHLSLVLNEAAEQAKRETACQERQGKLVQEAKAADQPQEQVTSQLYAIVLACRFEVLDAKDRLMRNLPPDAQLTFIHWVNERRSGMKVFVLKHELDFFRKPR